MSLQPKSACFCTLMPLHDCTLMSLQLNTFAHITAKHKKECHSQQKKIQDRITRETRTFGDHCLHGFNSFVSKAVYRWISWDFLLRELEGITQWFHCLQTHEITLRLVDSSSLYLLFMASLLFMATNLLLISCS